MCGVNLKTAPPPLTTSKIIWISALTVLLPPLGLIWAFKYLRTDDPQLKKFAWAIIIMTVLSSVITIWATFAALDTVKKSFQIDEQLNSLGY
jgi:K+-transporting ATPase A subunit